MIESTTAVAVVDGGDDALEDAIDDDDDDDVDVEDAFFLDAVKSESIEKLSLTLGVTGAVAFDSVVSMVTIPRCVQVGW